MAGDSSAPVTGAFPFRIKPPQTAPDLTARLLDAYARNRDKIRAALPIPDGPSRLRFLGSSPRIVSKGKSLELRWRWRLGEEGLRLRDPGTAEKLASLLEAASHREGLDTEEFYTALETLLGEAGAEQTWKGLRNGGLVIGNLYIILKDSLFRGVQIPEDRTQRQFKSFGYLSGFHPIFL